MIARLKKDAPGRTWQGIVWDAPKFEQVADKIEFHNELVRYHSYGEMKRLHGVGQAKMRARGAKVLWLRIYRRKTYAEIGKYLGISKERVRQIEARARREMRRLGE